MTFREAVLGGVWRAGAYGHPDSKDWKHIIPHFYGPHDCTKDGCQITEPPPEPFLTERIEQLISYAKRPTPSRPTPEPF